MSAHDAHMQKLRRGPVVHHDTLQFIDLPDTILLKGEIACLGNIIIEVNKTLAIVEDGHDPLVQTIDYSYNAWVRNHCTFLRYDNAHPLKGQIDPHHKHILNWRTGKGRPVHVGEADWPTLGKVIEEVEQWYWEHQHELPEPNAVAELGLWGPSQSDEDLESKAP